MERKAGSFLCVFLAASVCLAADAVPRGSERPQVDQLWKCVQTWEAMLALQTAIEAYGVDHPEYPKVTTIEEVRALVEPAYIARTPLVDAWGTPFRYVVSKDGQEFWIASAGSDRTFEEATWMTPAFLSSSARDAVRSSRGWKSYREWVIQP
ncbi:MAG TPA: type II secretion system protein GspG [Thermoanaerobaculia bacterium]|nr:type II secretion system protein GspG [Thermoanaerobaculia bacterium]